jgi:transcriptional regulator with XRE-family HTH domain
MVRSILIELRGNTGQSDVAKELNITQQFLSAIELGTRNPSIKIMKRFAKYYNKTVQELFPDIFYDTTEKCENENTIKYA